MRERDLPLISVILPTHNREHCIGGAIESVLCQGMADFELIVVDDGSTDRTVEAAGSTGDPRVRVVRLNENVGANAARNAGIRAARAPLVAFLDSDDSYLPDKLGFVVAEFERRPELDVLVDSYLVQFQDGRPDRQRLNARTEGEGFVDALYRRKLWKATPAISARREAVLRAGLFDEQLPRRQDFDFLARAAKVAHCGATDRLLWIKRWSPAAISSNDAMYIPATIAICRRNPEYLTNPRFFDVLARDIARHLLRQVRAGRLGGAARDMKLLQSEFGKTGALRMLHRGLREANERKRARQARCRLASPVGPSEQHLDRSEARIRAPARS